MSLSSLESPGSRAIASAVAVLSVVVMLLLSFNALRVTGWDPTLFLGFGAGAVEEIEYATDRLGRAPLDRPGRGHDGKSFFIQANDPLYLNPDNHAVYIDIPRYRAQRMLYPLLAGVLALFQPTAIVWTMLATNIAAVGIGGWLTAKLAEAMGMSAWWGLAFVVNLGVIFEWVISGSGILSFAFVIAGTLALERRNFRSAVLLFVLAVLAREVMLVYVIGVGVLEWRRHGIRAAAPIVATPLLAAIGWAAYLSSRLPPSGSLDSVGGLTLPFVGILDAIPNWLQSPFDGLSAFVYLGMLVVIVLRSLRSPTYLGWGSAAFLLLALSLSSAVWDRAFDFSRALIPTITAFLLLMFRQYSASAAERPGT